MTMQGISSGNIGRITFSVVIPAKNEERNMVRCLASLAALDWPREDLEVIVADNGSTDSTVEICESFGARVFIRPRDTVAALRNFGAAHSHGKILVFLDADCTVPPDWLRQAASYVDRPDVTCFGSPPLVPPASTWVQRAWFHVRRRIGTAEADWLESMNMFVRREGFEKVGGFNAELATCEDYDLSVRLRQAGRLVSDDRILAIHHGEAASLSHFFRKEHWRATGNLRGIASHAFEWREVPSVIMPLVYCFLASLLAASLLAAPFVPAESLAKSTLLLLLVWQVPLGFLAIWKVRNSGGLRDASQLFVLFNVYFFARGLASLRRR